MSITEANMELMTTGIRESCHHKWKIVIGFLLTILVHSFPVYAASFDCRKATIAAEKMICSDAALSKLDEDLAKVYLQALAVYACSQHVPTIGVGYALAEKTEAASNLVPVWMTTWPRLARL